MLLAVLLFLTPGCSFLLPTSQVAAKSKWRTYGEAEAAFDRIAPGATATNELSDLGFDPSANPNVRILTYVDIIQRFMPNQSITKDDLDPSVRASWKAVSEGKLGKWT
jgi:hypothetical protein